MFWQIFKRWTTSWTLCSNPISTPEPPSAIVQTHCNTIVAQAENSVVVLAEELRRRSGLSQPAPIFPDKSRPPMIKPQDGMWYIVVTCGGCKSTIFLFPDLNKGKGVVDANYVVTCPRCGNKGAYNGRHHF